ncbi:MAG: hypothetical protein AAF415_08690 [Pseudomonadota bacterium]
MDIQAFETRSVRMDRVLMIEIYAPEEDVDRIAASVTAIDPLAQGNHYDSNIFQTAPGVEWYRPREGAAAGPERDMRKRPGVVKLVFEIAEDHAKLHQIIEAVYQIHSYQEPVIRVRPILSSRTKGLDDSDNPNRWWNTSGDWKKA